MTVSPAEERRAIPSNSRPAIAKRDVAFMTVMRFFIICSFNLGANAPSFLMMFISWDWTFWRQQFPSSCFNAELRGQNYHRAAGFLREAVLVDFARDHEFNASHR